MRSYQFESEFVNLSAGCISLKRFKVPPLSCFHHHHPLLRASKDSYFMKSAARERHILQRAVLALLSHLERLRMSWRKGDGFPDRPPWPAPPKSPTMSLRDLRSHANAYDYRLRQAIAVWHPHAAAEKKVAQSQGMASSPVATNTTVGSPHLADGGAHKTMRLTATVEGNTTEGTVTLLATPAGGSEDASCEKQRKRKNDRLVCGLQKRLTHQAFEGYLTPKHDAIPEHFVWPVGGRKDRLAQLTLELSGRSAMPVIAEEGAASHDSILRITGENGAATGTSLVVEEPHGELVL